MFRSIPSFAQVSHARSFHGSSCSLSYKYGLLPSSFFSWFGLWLPLALEISSSSRSSTSPATFSPIYIGCSLVFLLMVRITAAFPCFENLDGIQVFDLPCLFLSCIHGLLSSRSSHHSESVCTLLYRKYQSIPRSYTFTITVPARCGLLLLGPLEAVFTLYFWTVTNQPRPGITTF